MNMQKTDEIKEWQTHSAKHTLAGVLMMDGVSFRYDEVNGITFLAPEDYVEKLKIRLVMAFGCSVRPIINEIK